MADVWPVRVRHAGHAFFSTAQLIYGHTAISTALLQLHSYQSVRAVTAFLKPLHLKIPQSPLFLQRKVLWQYIDHVREDYGA